MLLLTFQRQSHSYQPGPFSYPTHSASAAVICLWVCTDYKTAVSTDMKPEDKRFYVRKMRSCMNQRLHLPSGATKLFDFLYLAGEDDATNVQLLSDLGITHVINCAAGYNFCIYFAFLSP